MNTYKCERCGETTSKNLTVDSFMGICDTCNPPDLVTDEMLDDLNIWNVAASQHIKVN